MKCPYCDHCYSQVLYTRNNGMIKSIVRRRHCFKCERRYTTEEIIRNYDKKHKDESQKSA